MLNMIAFDMERRDLPHRLKKYNDYIYHYYDSYFIIVLDLYRDNTLVNKILNILYMQDIEYFEVEPDWLHDIEDVERFYYENMEIALEEFNEMFS